MFRTTARRLVLALSLLAAIGSMLPGAQTAAAAPTSLVDPVSAVRYDLVPTKPGLEIVAAPKMRVLNVLVQRNGRKTTYHYKIQADAGTLNNVSVRMYSLYNHQYDSGHGQSNDEVKNLGTVAAPSYLNFTLHCNPPAGSYCSAGIVEATTSGGLSAWGANAEDGNMFD